MDSTHTTRPERKSARFQRREHPDEFHSRFITQLAKRFYMDEQGVVVSNGLSTDLLCFPSDRLGEQQSHHRKYLSDKIHHAMQHAASFYDVEELNALEHIAPHGDRYGPDHYVTMGLYLYLEDECSRLKKGRTFLTALREADCSLNSTDDYDPDILLEKAKQALKSLGMEQSHGDLLDQWFTYGSFKLNGELQNGNGTKEALSGRYPLLARSICQRQDVLALNLCVSYALGNRTQIEGLSHEALLNRTQNMDNAGITSLIAQGDKSREETMRAAVEASVPPPPHIGSEAQSREKMEQAKHILEHVPNNVLELLCRESYMLAYSNGPDIDGCYPKGGLPGNAADKDTSNREGKALREGRYHMIFLSNGRRYRQADVAEDPELKSRVVAQSLMHEAMHVVSSYLTKDELAKLKAAVDAVHDELKAKKDSLPDYTHQYLQTVDTNTLCEVVDYESRLYKNYLHLNKDKSIESDTRWEEVACNTLGIMHAEYGKDGPQPFADPAGVTSLANLKQEVEAAVDLAVTRATEKHVRMHGGRERR